MPPLFDKWCNECLFGVTEFQNNTSQLSTVEIDEAVNFTKQKEETVDSEHQFYLFNKSIMALRQVDEVRDHVKNNCSIIPMKDSLFYDKRDYFRDNELVIYLNQINRAMLYLNLSSPRNLIEMKYQSKELQRLYYLYESFTGGHPRSESLVVPKMEAQDSSEFCQAAALTFHVFDVIINSLIYNLISVRDFYLARIKASKEKHLELLIQTNIEKPPSPMASRLSYSNLESYGLLGHLSDRQKMVLSVAIFAVTSTIIFIFFFRASVVFVWLMAQTRRLVSFILCHPENPAPSKKMIYQEVCPV